MIHIITAVGVLICALAAAGLANPAFLNGLGARVVRSKGLRTAAVAARIIFGAVLIIAAEQTAYPWPMKFLGVLAIMAGTLVAMVGRATLERWLAGLAASPGAGRLLSLAALLMGALLVHASV